MTDSINDPYVDGQERMARFLWMALRLDLGGVRPAIVEEAIAKEKALRAVESACASEYTAMANAGDPRAAELATLAEQLQKARWQEPGVTMTDMLDQLRDHLTRAIRWITPGDVREAELQMRGAACLLVSLARSMLGSLSPILTLEDLPSPLAARLKRAEEAGVDVGLPEGLPIDDLVTRMAGMLGAAAVVVDAAERVREILPRTALTSAKGSRWARLDVALLPGRP